MNFNTIEGRVLRYLERRFVAGGGFGSAMPDEIMKENGLQPDQYTRLIARFESLGILEEVTLDGLISIKGAACNYVADLDHDRSTPPPPTVNIMNIGQVSHSQIQQGTVGSTQTSSHGPQVVHRDVADDVVLSVGASTLLCAAGKTGQIIVCVDSAGLHVQAGGKQFGTSFADPRRKAQVESELDELASNGLITVQGQVRSVTTRGYQWIDA